MRGEGMKLSTKGRYGLRALVDLAANAGKETAPLVHTARRQKLSLNYLEQVFALLRKAGIVKTVKGSAGGYALACDMDELTVKEVLEVMEGRFAIVDYDGAADEDPVRKAIRCLLWEEIDSQVENLLEKQTLGNLVRNYQDSHEMRARLAGEDEE